MNFSWQNVFSSEAKSESNKHKILGSKLDEEPKENQDVIIFGCGCFWGAEKCFWRLPGVISTSVGYSGGDLLNPSYEQVCSGYTGHAEVVRIIWDKRIIDLSDLLKMFWECHDPTQKDRQGNDRGSQYRSIIIYSNKEQYNKIIESKKSYQIELKKEGYGNIETEIQENSSYYLAEDYHQQYLSITSNRQYCSAEPTKVLLGQFNTCNYKLQQSVWEEFNWRVSKCVLRSSNEQIKFS
tara:strand:- start:816 stop:1529 length:714 start_codon:yes stop_codon:yes gene_type:complete